MPRSPEDEAALHTIAAQFDASLTAVFGNSSLEPLRPRTQRSPRPSLRKEPLSIQHRYTLRIDLNESHPPIWRRLRVHSDISLHTLHLAVQGAFDWGDYHLYRFALGHPFDRDSELFLCDWDVEEGEDQGLPATDVRLDETLQQPNDLLRYVYDYGDDWGLRIRLEEVSNAEPDAPAAVCIGGRRAAPPEDCGSLRTAEQLSSVIPDPAHFDLDEANEQIISYLNPPDELTGMPGDEDLLPLLAGYPEFHELFTLTANPFARLSIAHDLQSLRLGPRYLNPQLDPEVDEPESIDPAMLDLEAEFEPLLWLLNRIAGGVKLTQAGYLPPDIVREFALMLFSDEDLSIWRRHHSESQLRQLAAYRRHLHRLGLLRKSRGMLLLTRAGAAAKQTPELLWSHLVDRFAAAIEPTPGKRDFDRDATALTLLEAAAGNGRLDMESVAGHLTQAGWGYTNGSPIRFADITWGGACPAVLFWFMGPRDERHWHSARIRPSAVVLAHAALTTTD